MRRIVPFLLLLLLSCQKETTLQTISLNIGVESGEIKSPSSSVSAIKPSKNISLTLVSTTNTARRYTVNCGESITIPVDTYNVTGTYKPSSLFATLYSGLVYNEPSYYVDTRITIKEGVNSYSVSATYSCFALVIDNNVCTKYVIRDYYGKDIDLEGWVTNESYGVLFLKVNIGSNIFPLNAYPKDVVNFEMKNYPLTFSGTGVVVENGKWYMFSPEGVDKEEGTIGTILPDWEEGNI